MRLTRTLYRYLSSTHLTLILLFMLIACMLLGTVFPQGGSLGEYEEAFGRTRALWLGRFGLFDVFHSWYFLLAGAVFFLNLIFCSIEGWRSHLRPKAAAFREASTAVWDVGKGGKKQLLETLTRRGYRLRTLDESGQTLSLVAQRGLPSRPASVIYHFGLALTFVGFVLSALTAFDGEVYLFPGETKKIPRSSPGMTVNRWKERLGIKPREADSLAVHLDSFETEYTWYDVKYYPREWKSALLLSTDSGIALRKVIEVNAPLRWRGLTVYQMSYKQEFDVELEDTTLHVEAGSPFEVPGLAGSFSLKSVRTGTLFKEGDTVSMVPNGDLYYKAPDAKKSARVGRLTLGSKYYFKGTPMTMKNFKEATGLYYRRDDGVVFLYVAFLLFMIGLFLRIFWPSYRISLYLDEGYGKAYLSARVAGVAAYEDSELLAIRRSFEEGA